MRYGRVEVDGLAQWATFDDEIALLLDGPPYEGGQPVGCARPLKSVRLLAPVTPTKIFCLGRNYAGHRTEMGYHSDEAPSVFMKGPSTIIGPGADIVLPPASMSTHVEHEAELAVVIGATARFVTAADSADYILGYTCANDVSARDLQRRDPHPTRAKGFDTFCPVGPWIETDLAPQASISIRCWVNNELRQAGSTEDMTYGIPFLIEYLSSFATLCPGDLILTGSPAGTKPIQPGDHVMVGIEGIGTLTNGVAAADRH